MSLVEAMKQSPAFGSFNEEELVMLERAMEVREHQDGTVLIREGERGDTFYLIVEGTIRVTAARADGGALDLGTMGAGEVFGLLALIDHEPRSATCTAEGDVVLACLPRSAFTLLFEAETSLAYRFQLMVCRQLAGDARSLNEVLASAMLAAAEGESTEASESLSLDFRLSMED
jgi:CRP/FNR family transcriptional regulator